MRGGKRVCQNEICSASKGIKDEDPIPRHTHKDKLTLQIQRPKGIKKSVYFISLGARLISNQTEILYGGGGADDDDADGVINRDLERVSDDE